MNLEIVHFFVAIDMTEPNGINFYKYLEYLCSELPKYYGNPTEELLAAYLPWNPEFQRRCKLQEES